MQKLILVFTAAAILFFTVSCHSNSTPRQSPQDSVAVVKQQLADSVKQEFLHAWNGYVKYAWGHDALKPLSKTPHDWYSHSLLMTPMDGFDTMILMGLKTQADSAKKLILDSLNFDQDMEVSNFEITIRMLGGLLSAYEWDGDKKFLALATDLAHRLMPAFHSPTGMPYRFVNLKTGKTSGNVSNPAEIGTMLIEYGTLSKLTGDQTYYKTAKKALTVLFSHRSKIGLVGSAINVDNGQWVDKGSSIAGGTDSYYEYLLKSWKLFGDTDCKKMWDSSLIAINKYLADTVQSGFWYGHVQMDTGKIVQPVYGALDAFFAACLAMDGDLPRAKALQASNFKMWELYGIEPETLNFEKMQVLDGGYVLRPENLESCYYLYHYTKDPQYLDMGKTMFESIVRHCRTDAGYAAIKDVRNMTPDDSMESFFFAETLKYAYLIFAGDKALDFDKVIFNTEAHPMKM